RPCLSSSFLSSSAGAALASLPPKIAAPAFLMKLISPMMCSRSSAEDRPYVAIRAVARPNGLLPNVRKQARGGENARRSRLPGVVADHTDERRDDCASHQPMGEVDDRWRHGSLCSTPISNPGLAAISSLGRIFGTTV